MGLDVLTAEGAEAAASLEANASIWGVVLAGGIGSRFWPVSGPRRPKQLLELLGDKPMIAGCVERLSPLIPPERVVVVTSADIASAIRGAIPQVPPANILVEPRPLGTAAAIALATATLMQRVGPETVVCALAADIAAAFGDPFRDTVRHAAGVASRDDAITLIGARPARSEPGFGYVIPVGASRSSDGPEAASPVKVQRFIEKPPAEEAASLIDGGAWWHTGISVWRARVMWNALREQTAEISAALSLLEAGDTDRYFGAVESISIERGLFERSRDLLLVPGEFGWDDIGTWASLRRARDLDDDGNGARGDVHFVDASGNVVHAERGDVVLYGVDNLLVVTVDGITLVTTIDRAADLRPLLDRLPGDVRGQTSEMRRP